VVNFIHNYTLYSQLNHSFVQYAILSSLHDIAILFLQIEISLQHNRNSGGCPGLHMLTYTNVKLYEEFMIRCMHFVSDG